MSLKFEKIIPNQNQINSLYELLEGRDFNISHKNMPTFKEHEHFVKNHPYIEWFIIKKKNSKIGTLYIQKDNSIGLNLYEKFVKQDLKNCIEFINNNFSPLNPIKSIRRDTFYVNVSSNNKKLIKAFNELGKNELQVSFLI